MKEFLDLLGEYVRGAQPFSALGRWLAGVDWDDPDLTEEEQEVFGLVELLTTDVSEGFREEEELISEAIAVIARFVPQEENCSLLQDTNAKTIIFGVVTAATDSSNQQSWNKSPQLVTS